MGVSTGSVTDLNTSRITSEHSRETEAAFLSWAYVQGFSLSPSPSSTVLLLFVDCQADISERKHLYKLSDHIFGTSYLRLQ